MYRTQGSEDSSGIKRRTNLEASSFMRESLMGENNDDEDDDGTPDWLAKANEETIKNNASNDPWTEDILTDDFENV